MILATIENILQLLDVSNIIHSIRELITKKKTQI